jgi:hypothetical protein
VIIIFNWIGAGILVLAMLIGGVLASGFAMFFGKAALQLAMACSGVVVIILDLLYRFKAGEGNLLHPRRGGHVFFIPVWIIGGFFILMSICELVSPGVFDSDRARTARRAQADQVTPVYARTADESPAQPSSQRVAPGWDHSRPTAPAQNVEPPPTLDGLKVAMISGAPGHRVATINGEPFSEGETHKLTCGQRKLTIQCVEIRDQSVVAKVQGEMHLRQLKVGHLVPLSGD